jgi:hypothetical protein
MKFQKIKTVFLTNLDMLMPDIVQAAQLLTREKVIDGAVQMAPGQPYPEGMLLIVPHEKLKLMPVYDALRKISEVTGVVFRETGEVPVVSEEYARSRGFDDQEIETHLRPWVAQRQKTAGKRVEETKKAYEDAVVEAALAFNDTVASKGTLTDLQTHATQDHPTAITPPADTTQLLTQPFTAHT